MSLRVDTHGPSVLGEDHSQGYWGCIFQGLRSETNGCWVPRWMPSVQWHFFRHRNASEVVNQGARLTCSGWDNEGARVFLSVRDNVVLVLPTSPTLLL